MNLEKYFLARDRIKFNNSLLSLLRLDGASDVALSGFTCINRQSVFLAKDDFLSCVLDELAFICVSSQCGLQDEWRSFDFFASVADNDAKREIKVLLKSLHNKIQTYL